MKLYVGAKGYKKHVKDKNVSNHYKQHKKTVVVTIQCMCTAKTCVTWHIQRNVLVTQVIKENF